MNNIWKPHITVAAVIENDGRFLLVREAVGGREVFNQPAGHLDPDETLYQAAIRETLEETGYRFVPESLVGIYQWRSPGEQRSFIRFAFTGRAEPDPAVTGLDPDILGIEWRSRESSRWEIEHAAR